jgi:hypothetical protein
MIQAIDIGYIPKIQHYNVVMRFTDNLGRASEFKPFAGFTLFDRDKLYYYVLGVFTTVICSGLITLFLKGCGIVK